MKKIINEKFFIQVGLIFSFFLSFISILQELNPDGFHIEFSIWILLVFLIINQLFFFLFFILAKKYFKGQANNIYLKKYYIANLIVGTLNLISPFLSFFDWISEKISPPKPPSTGLEKIVLAFAKTVFKASDYTKTLNLISEIILIVLAFCIITTMYFVVVSRKIFYTNKNN